MWMKSESSTKHLRTWALQKTWTHPECCTKPRRLGDGMMAQLLFKHMKQRIENCGNHFGTSNLRLKSDLGPMSDLPTFMNCTVWCERQVLLLITRTIKVKPDKQNLTGLYISRNVWWWANNSSITSGFLETHTLRLHPTLTRLESAV